MSALRTRSDEVSSSPAIADADAGGREHLAAVERERVAQRVHDALHHGDRARIVLRVLEQHRELVAAQPRDGVGRAHAREQPLRGDREQPVAHPVAQAVVHRLEVVDVEEDQRELLLVAPRERERVRHPVEEERAIRETGELIVERLVRELRLQRLAVAHVARVHDDAPHRRLVHQVREGHLDRAPAAVRVPAAPLHGRERRVRLERLGEVARGVRLVVRMDQVHHVHAVELRGRVAEIAGDRRTRVAQHAAWVHDRDDVRRALHQRAEAALRLAGGAFVEQADVLAHRQDLPQQHEQRDDRGAHREHGDLARPFARRRPEHQAVRDRDGRVRQRTLRLRDRRLDLRLRPDLRHAPVVLPEAPQDQAIGRDVHVVEPADRVEPHILHHDVVREVGHQEEQEPDEEEPGRPALDVRRTPQDHRHDAEEQQQRQQRVRERDRAPRVAARGPVQTLVEDEEPHREPAAHHDDGRVEHELPVLPLHAPGHRQRQERHERDEVAAERHQIHP